MSAFCESLRRESQTSPKKFEKIPFRNAARKFSLPEPLKHRKSRRSSTDTELCVNMNKIILLKENLRRSCLFGDQLLEENEKLKSKLSHVHMKFNDLEQQSVDEKCLLEQQINEFSTENVQVKVKKQLIDLENESLKKEVSELIHENKRLMATNTVIQTSLLSTQSELARVNNEKVEIDSEKNVLQKQVKIFRVLQKSMSSPNFNAERDKEQSHDESVGRILDLVTHKSLNNLKQFDLNKSSKGIKSELKTLRLKLRKLKYSFKNQLSRLETTLVEECHGYLAKFFSPATPCDSQLGGGFLNVVDAAKNGYFNESKSKEKKKKKKKKCSISRQRDKWRRKVKRVMPERSGVVYLVKCGSIFGEKRIQFLEISAKFYLFSLYSSSKKEKLSHQYSLSQGELLHFAKSESLFGMRFGGEKTFVFNVFDERERRKWEGYIQTLLMLFKTNDGMRRDSRCSTGFFL